MVMSQDRVLELEKRLSDVQGRFQEEMAEKRAIDSGLSFPASSSSVLAPALVAAAVRMELLHPRLLIVALSGLAAVTVAQVLVAHVWAGYRYGQRPTLEEEEALRRTARVAVEKGTLLALRARSAHATSVASADEIYLLEMLRRMRAVVDVAADLNKRRRDRFQVIVALLLVGLMGLILCGTLALSLEGTP